MMENLTLDQQAKILLRGGIILERTDKEDDRGFRSVFFIEHEGLNGLFVCATER